MKLRVAPSSVGEPNQIFLPGSQVICCPFATPSLRTSPSKAHDYMSVTCHLFCSFSEYFVGSNLAYTPHVSEQCLKTKATSCICIAFLFASFYSSVNCSFSLSFALALSMAWTVSVFPRTKFGMYVCLNITIELRLGSSKHYC